MKAAILVNSSSGHACVVSLVGTAPGLERGVSGGEIGMVDILFGRVVRCIERAD